MVLGRWTSLLLLLMCALPGLSEAQSSFDRLAPLRVVVPKDRSDAFVALTPELEPGFDREILDGFATLHKTTVQLITVPTWGDLAPALLDGKADIIAGGYSDTAERRKRIAFTVEVFPSRDVVFTLKPYRVVKTLEELRTERIVTHRGSSMAESLIAAGVPPARISYVIDTSVKDRILKGDATVGVLGLEVAVLARRADSNVQLGLFLGQPGSLAYGVRQTDTHLLEELNRYVTSHRRSLAWNRLVVKYFGEDALDILKAARAPTP